MPPTPHPPPGPVVYNMIPEFTYIFPGKIFVWEVREGGEELCKYLVFVTMTKQNDNVG